MSVVKIKKSLFFVKVEYEKLPVEIIDNQSINITFE
jgi:hypothetical protein